MTTITILALDPGGTTGWARFRALAMYNPILSQTEYYDTKWTRGQLGPEPHHQALTTLLEMSYTEEYHIVCESFEYRNNSRAGLVLDSVEYIGVTKLFLLQEKRFNVSLHMQTASMGKGFVKDENIKKLGLWFPSQKHAMDATRHLLYYMINTAGIMKQDLLTRGWK